MNPSRLFIERPVATLLLTLAALLCGFLCLKQLPISALPEVDYPVIQVTAQFPGASPDIMTRTVTAPLEHRLGRIAGLAQMYSVSSGGATAITLRFNLDVSLDVAEQEVQAAINTADSLLPSDLPNKPTYRKVNPADAPIMTLAATSESLPLITVQDLVNSRAALRLSQITGVGLVSLAGGSQPAVRIAADPEALAAHGLGLADVTTLITRQSVNSSKGSFDGKDRAVTIDANDQIRSPSEYSDLILKWSSSKPLRLADVARVTNDAQDLFQEARVNGKPAILVNIQRQPGTNVVEIANRIKAMLPSIRETLPAAVSLEVVADRTQSIRAAVSGTELELLASILLVVAVSWAFLHSTAATFIPGTAVPLSIICTFGVMHAAGFSLNNLTLMALTIATGFVIDDAIVVVENIERHIEGGEKPFAAALAGSREIGFTIVSLTISLVAVLIPLLFMGDVAGRLFREFSITLAAAILVSMCVSLTLTPMMCARLLRPVGAEPLTGLSGVLERSFAALTRGYGRCLDAVLRHQAATLAVAAGTLAATAALYAWVPLGFFPEQDTGIIQVTAQADSNISFAEMVRREQALSELIARDPAVQAVTSITGIDGTNTTTLNTGRLQVILKDWSARSKASDVAARISQAAGSIAGLSVTATAQQDLNVDDQVTAGHYQFTLMDPERSELEQWVPKLTASLSASPLFADVSNNLTNDTQVLRMTIRREEAARYGITAADIASALYSAFGQRLISTIYTQSSQYRVVLEVDRRFQQDDSGLKHIYVPSSSDAAVPLANLVRVEHARGYSQIARLRQAPAATVTFNLAPGATLEAAYAQIRELEKTFPESLTLKLQGTLDAFSKAGANTLPLILAAVLTMYIVLGILYESFVHPVTVLSTLPSAAVGAFLALAATGSEFTLSALIGIILLIGIVKKNAIMLIDFAIAERRTGASAEDAIRRACLLRLRPILMTTCAAMLGAVPLLAATGSGAELRQPLGLVIIAGLTLSQLMTLFTTPVIYLAFERLSASHREPRP